MANTDGGRIVYETVSCKPAKLDSANIDNQVNNYVAPKVHRISSELTENGCIVCVQASKSAPHIFTKYGGYLDGKKQEHEFHSGQIWVRHSSKNAPANGDDLRRLIQYRVAGFLGELEAKIRIGGHAEDGIILRSSDGSPYSIEGIPVRPDPSKYHLRTSEVGRRVGKNQYWVAIAAKKLGIKDDPQCCIQLSGAVGYSEHAVSRLAEHIKTNPDWSPYRD